MIKFRLKQEGPLIDDQKLIEEVSKHAFLYDTRSSDYRNLPLRATVWSLIAKNLNIEDNNIVQKRWKVLREKFSLSYRRQVLEEMNSSNWMLYDSLTFLEPFVNLKPESKKAKENESINNDNKAELQPKNPLDEQVLIQLVKERPVLFDKKHEDFRVGNARKKAWDEISSIVKWDIDVLQKRWRVMRDRFVRELRKSKNVDSDVQLTCSSFFREMLFLTHHVKSKKYEVEAHFDDSDDSRGYEYEQYETNVFAGKKEQTEENTTVEIVTEQNYAQYIDNNDEMDSSLKYEEAILEEHIEVQDDEFIEEIVECPPNDDDDLLASDEHGNEIIALQEITKDEWIKRENTTSKTSNKKRRISNNEAIVSSSKLARNSEASQFTLVNSTETSSSENDEDATFGNTLGCMLKRIPQHLKTAVKLKLLQSLAEFEAEHKI